MGWVVGHFDSCSKRNLAKKIYTMTPYPDRVTVDTQLYMLN
jgi:hypothetical protein